MVHRTILRCQREPRRGRSALCEQREPAFERQHLERRVSASSVLPETIKFLLHLCGGVFFSRPFFQPPSILPISCKCSDRAEYFSFGMHLFPQAICRKNFMPSSLEIAMMRRGILVSGGRYIETKIFSKRPRK
ncbi:MAG: hypothetical protein UU01_C0002G0035 [Parcubacteria group bacterium GW2011_GWA2_40_37]|nr:MAG: hypothetical protein UU01_C0002G0035 [Parcubacteria group bacterium GW2011_GWA2_40_37]